MSRSWAAFLGRRRLRHAARGLFLLDSPAREGGGSRGPGRGVPVPAVVGASPGGRPGNLDEALTRERAGHRQSLARLARSRLAARLFSAPLLEVVQVGDWRLSGCLPSPPTPETRRACQPREQRRQRQGTANHARAVLHDPPCLVRPCDPRTTNPRPSSETRSTPDRGPTRSRIRNPAGRPWRAAFLTASRAI